MVHEDRNVMEPCIQEVAWNGAGTRVQPRLMLDSSPVRLMEIPGSEQTQSLLIIQMKAHLDPLAAPPARRTRPGAPRAPGSSRMPSRIVG